MGMVEYAWSHAIISDQLHANIFKECNFSVDIENLTLSCLNYYRDFLVSYSKIDIYNIYAPTCLSSSLDSVFRLVSAAPRTFSKYVRFHIHRKTLQTGFFSSITTDFKRVESSTFGIVVSVLSDDLYVRFDA